MKNKSIFKTVLFTLFLSTSTYADGPLFFPMDDDTAIMAYAQKLARQHESPQDANAPEKPAKISRFFQEHEHIPQLADENIANILSKKLLNRHLFKDRLLQASFSLHNQIGTPLGRINQSTLSWLDAESVYVIPGLSDRLNVQAMSEPEATPSLLDRWMSNIKEFFVGKPKDTQPIENVNPAQRQQYFKLANASATKPLEKEELPSIALKEMMLSNALTINAPEPLSMQLAQPRTRLGS